MGAKTEEINAILLVMFGTSVEQGLPGLLHVRDRMAERFPHTLLNMAFSSKVIRGIWMKRAADRGYRQAHPEIPEEIFSSRSPEDVMHALTGQNIQGLVVQPVQIAPALSETVVKDSVRGLETDPVEGLGGIAVGRPVLGWLDSARYPYPEDITAVVRSLEQDAVLARQKKAALFYMGHGDGSADTDQVYRELVLEMRNRYPDIPTVMGMVKEGASTSELIRTLKERQVKNVILKPFMVVAGNHVRKEMIGSGSEALKPALEKAGFIVHPVVSGLGEIPAFADILVRHAADAAHDAGILLN